MTLNIKLCAALVATVCAFTLSACSTIIPTAEQSRESKLRITDKAIFSDQKEMQQLQDNLAMLNKSKGISLDSYLHAKTQCWLDVAAHEYLRNDRSGFIEYALKNTRNGITQMESGVQPNDVAASHRPFCSQAQRACAEVREEHAQHEEKQFGWRHARPYQAIAQDLKRQVSIKEQACVIEQPVAQTIIQAVVPVPVPAIKSEPVAAAVIPPSPPVAPRVISKLVLLSEALFPFNRAEPQDFSPAGKARIDELIAKVKSFSPNEFASYKFQITGYADRFGSENYNRVLAEKRASTIREFLISKGANPSNITASAGAWKATADSCTSGDKQTQIACLASDRRVEIEVTQ
jgi:OmpA-OmpF porin, OOP family